jgi:hypothetical protein
LILTTVPMPGSEPRCSYHSAAPKRAKRLQRLHPIQTTYSSILGEAPLSVNYFFLDAHEMQGHHYLRCHMGVKANNSHRVRSVPFISRNEQYRDNPHTMPVGGAMARSGRFECLRQELGGGYGLAVDSSIVDLTGGHAGTCILV